MKLEHPLLKSLYVYIDLIELVFDILTGLFLNSWVFCLFARHFWKLQILMGVPCASLNLYGTLTSRSIYNFYFRWVLQEKIMIIESSGFCQSFYFLSYFTFLLWHFKFLLEYQYISGCHLEHFHSSWKIPNICAALTERISFLIN